MNVALFVTCLADQYFADAAADAVRLLRHLGCTVTFPDAQTCCGQPAYNAGRNAEALRMARHTAGVFADAEAVVLPSGSCATMVRKFYPRLMPEPVSRADQPASRGSTRRARATSLTERTWELGEFIVHHLGVTALGDGLAGRRVAIHQGAMRCANCASNRSRRSCWKGRARKSSPGRLMMSVAASGASSP